MSVNLSKEKRNKLVEKINAIKEYIEAKNDDKSSQLLRYISDIEKDINSKRYGIVYEEHEEDVGQQLETNLPVLTEDTDWFINNGGEMNFLIEGDNLASLQLLEKTHKGRIDLIYIDPPYNTGNEDFIYDDCFVDSSDLFRHSKWLSFMNKRLKKAVSLLADDGVIFISIDDNEYANLKILCDDVFGERNHIGTIIQNKGNAQNDALNIQKNHEYILCYRKKKQVDDKGKEIPVLYIKKYIENVIYKDQLGYYYKNGGIVTGGEGGTLSHRPNLGYTIYYNPLTEDKVAVQDYDLELAKLSNDENEVYKTDSDLISKGYVAIRPPKKGNVLGVWTWSLDKFNLEKDKILISKNADTFSIIKKQYVTEKEVVSKNEKMFVRIEKDVNSKSIIDFSTSKGSTSLATLIGSKKFNNPKNLDMIKYLIGLFYRKNITVLDFFAGSGTTGQAVLELNKEDGGNRTVILCTNNENNICRSVTYERIKRFIDKENYKTSFKYMKVDFLSTDEKTYYEYMDELLQHVKELVELENGVNFTENAKIAIILTDEELDKFVANIKEYNCEVIYLGHEVLPTEEQENIFVEQNVKIKSIPDYFYKDMEA